VCTILNKLFHLLSSSSPCAFKIPKCLCPPPLLPEPPTWGLARFELSLTLFDCGWSLLSHGAGDLRRQQRNLSLSREPQAALARPICSRTSLRMASIEAFSSWTARRDSPGRQACSCGGWSGLCRPRLCGRWYRKPARDASLRTPIAIENICPKSIDSSELTRIERAWRLHVVLQCFNLKSSNASQARQVRPRLVHAAGLIGHVPYRHGRPLSDEFRGCRGRSWIGALDPTLFVCGWSLLNPRRGADTKRLDMGNLNPIYERELTKLELHQGEGRWSVSNNGARRRGCRHK
jgi:hypothetical protein